MKRGCDHREPLYALARQPRIYPAAGRRCSFSRGTAGRTARRSVRRAARLPAERAISGTDSGAGRSQAGRSSESGGSEADHRSDGRHRRHFEHHTESPENRRHRAAVRADDQIARRFAGLEEDRRSRKHEHRTAPPPAQTARRPKAAQRKSPARIAQTRRHPELRRDVLTTKTKALPSLTGHRQSLLAVRLGSDTCQTSLSSVPKQSTPTSVPLVNADVLSRSIHFPVASAPFPRLSSVQVSERNSCASGTMLHRIAIHFPFFQVHARHSLSRPFSYTHHRHIRTDADGTAGHRFQSARLGWTAVPAPHFHHNGGQILSAIPKYG